MAPAIVPLPFPHQPDSPTPPIMRTTTVTSRTALGGVFLLLGATPAPREAAAIKVDIATLHAAALTQARDSADVTDGAYLLVSVVGPHSAVTTLRLPTDAHLHQTVRQDQALPPMALGSFSLEPGDSVRVMISVLEADQVSPVQETQAAQGTIDVMLSKQANPLADLVAAALAPVTRLGAHWIGSASILLTNEGGTARWRGFDCVQSCQVLQEITAGELAPGATHPSAGVVELSGSSGTYHMQLAVKRTG